MSRQNFYAQRKQRQMRKVNEEFIVHLVGKQKNHHPNMGGRKIRHILKKDFQENAIQMGRDRFFDLLKRSDLLVKKKKIFHPKTTNSRHYLPTFSNLTSTIELTAPNQVWVSDITYIRTQEGFMYASLITDSYSRKIVGAYLGDNMEVEGCLKSLNMALKNRPLGEYPIHHSDRGSQYCSHAYVNCAKEANLKVSMTEANHCYENAKAERVNGILKHEYGMATDFKTKAQAKKAFDQAIYLYNHFRPHLSLDFKVPDEVHQQKVA